MTDYDKKYKDYSDFVDHFKEMTGGSSEQQFINRVDQWLWNYGYRIDRAGGLIPERTWSYGTNRIIVRNLECLFSSVELPETEEQFVAYLNNNKNWWV